MNELMATLKAIRDREDRERKFLAAIQGVDLDAELEDEKAEEDVSALMNPHIASQEGFGVGEGLGFMQMGGVE
jgi:hypothetical protein